MIFLQSLMRLLRILADSCQCIDQCMMNLLFRTARVVVSIEWSGTCPDNMLHNTNAVASSAKTDYCVMRNSHIRTYCVGVSALCVPLTTSASASLFRVMYS